MTNNKNLVKLAKANKTTKKSVAKSQTKKSSEKKLTPIEERDIKAKKVVEELLENSSLITLNKNKEEILELDEENSQESKGIEWLEEQIQLLTEQNENLRSELDLVKEDYRKILNENQNLKNSLGISDNDINVKNNVMALFNEIQENHIRMGIDRNGIGNLRIYCPAFLNRMIKFFPFLDEIKKY